MRISNTIEPLGILLKQKSLRKKIFSQFSQAGTGTKITTALLEGKYRSPYLPWINRYQCISSLQQDFGSSEWYYI